MRTSFLLVALFLCFLKISLQAGDTTFVKAHDKRHLNWYGNFDEWTVFPNTGQSYERIWLNFTYGCPTTNCSQWDYTTKVFYREHTGTIDSTLNQAPWFTSNGQTPDSLRFNLDTTWTYFFNTTTMLTDSSPSTPINIIEYRDTLNPQTSTNSFTAFPSGYYNYLYDTNGTIIDSLWVMPDSTWMQGYWPYWNVFEVVNDIEIARAITPYGGLLPNTWSFTWVSDVTDFAPLFKDSAEFRVVYEGYQDGFTVSLDFALVHGTPAREALAVERMWTGGFAYGIQTDPIENRLDARVVTIPTFATGGTKLRILQTGHGFGGNQNCAEFCPKNHYILVNNTITHTGKVWRDQCGLNPIFPQGGTWLYDRAAWCPGEIVYPFEHELTPFVTLGASHTLDMDMDPFTNVNNNFPGYGVGANLIYYGSPNFTRDAGLEDILAPSRDMRYHRFNPVCGKPRIVIRNSGTQSLNTVDIEYGIIGGTPSVYTWNAGTALSFLDTAWIDLPPPVYSDPSASGKFFARIASVNGSGSDEYATNDTLMSLMEQPPLYTDGIIIAIKANSAAAQTRVDVYDESGNTVFNKANYTANALERDTLLLPHGCYKFELKDSGKNGLSFFTFNNDGAGTARLHNVSSGAMLVNFDPNFGTSQIHYFTVGYGLQEDKIAEQIEWSIYPNPSSGSFRVEGNITESLQVEVYSLQGNRVFYQEDVLANQEIFLNTITPGMYLIRILSESGKVHSDRLLLTPH